jgi:uncharacterized protein with von Willebrand factor type A (vWA) domain
VNAGAPRRPDLADVAAHVGQVLRHAGVAATPQRSGRFALALHVAAPASLEELYWLGRVTLLADHSQVPTWDRVFAQIFGGVVDLADFRAPAEGPWRPARLGDLRTASGNRPGLVDTTAGLGPAPAATGVDNGEPRPGLPETVMMTASNLERLRAWDFGAMTPDELVWLRAAIRNLAVRTPSRRSRRRVRGRRGEQVDLRATLRRAQRTGGDPVSYQWRRHRTRPRKLVLLCDISGSMEAYSRAYLQLLLGAVAGAKAEAFVFATRLTRITPALRGVNPDRALERAGRAAPDWSGGTRIGGALKAFTDGWGRPGAARAAVVVIISDGWERGDPALLAEEMRRLRRLAYRLVWINPRRADHRFRPLTSGMAAALPYVDAFVSGHSLRAMDEVLAAIGA